MEQLHKIALLKTVSVISRDVSICFVYKKQFLCTYVLTDFVYSLILFLDGATVETHKYTVITITFFMWKERQFLNYQTLCCITIINI